MKIALFAVVFTAASFLVPVAGATEPESVVIGISVALSGPNARAGQEQLRGVQLWAEEINGRGGLFGHRITVTHYDDGGDPAASAQRHEKLLAEDRAAITIGPASADAALSAAAVAEKYATPMIVPAAIAKAAWGRGRKYAFALYAPAETSMDPVLAFARGQGLRRIALIHQNTALAQEMADGVKAKANALGMRVVFEQKYENDATDFSGIVGTLKLKRPDVMILGSRLPDAVAFVRQAKENKFSARVMALFAGPSAPDMAAALGADAEGLMSGGGWEPALKTGGTADFVRRYKQKVGHEAGIHAASGYAAGQLVEAAAKRAGSFEREALRTALSEIDALTLLGRYKVDAAGWQVGASSAIVQWINGERAVVFPREAAAQAVTYPFQAWSKR